MLELDDPRWTELDGGYRMRFDPRPLLAKLEAGEDDAATWSDLWDELHHQGDVGEASFAAVPQLVRIHRSSGTIDWNIYAMVAIIELARKVGANPDVPDWLKDDYFQAISELARIGVAQILRTEDPRTAEAILGVLALDRGLRTYAELLVRYSEDEISVLKAQF